ncbi:hypothetical protein P154DRAFT_130745 [Amniculicola lignicola CBS 123094]|uniref:Uncharacterized protein n=1 Tax=Amniculicola lignicola CBS 123094 TaxID=1392246 RepID=A0A6A5WQZ8_9PLEO|nr:hypothetical protein P154DRAFT_130745 [Amniculicola lignicola CBS 123094]
MRGRKHNRSPILYTILRLIARQIFPMAARQALGIVERAWTWLRSWYTSDAAPHRPTDEALAIQNPVSVYANMANNNISQAFVNWLTPDNRRHLLGKMQRFAGEHDQHPLASSSSSPPTSPTLTPPPSTPPPPYQLLNDPAKPDEPPRTCPACGIRIKTVEVRDRGGFDQNGFDDHMLHRDMPGYHPCWGSTLLLAQVMILEVRTVVRALALIVIGHLQSRTVKRAFLLLVVVAAVMRVGGSGEDGSDSGEEYLSAGSKGSTSEYSEYEPAYRGIGSFFLEYGDEGYVD